MFRARERGMSYWPFVITVFLFLVAGYAWFEASGKVTDLDQKLEKAQNDAKALRAKFETANNALLEVVDVTGFKNDQGYVDKAAMEAAIAAFLQGYREHAAMETETSKFTPSAGGGEIEEIGQGKIRVNYIPSAGSMSANPTVEELLPIIMNGAQRQVIDLRAQVAEKAAAVAAQKAAEEEHGKALASKDQTRDELSTQISALKNNLTEQGNDLRDQIAAHKSQAESARQERDEVRTQAEETEAKLGNQLSQAQGTVARLNDREKPFASEGPDGEILASSAGMVVVNRGKKDMLMPGTLFTVLQRQKGGALKATGTVKITSVGDETSRGSLIEATDVVSEGDLIQSTMYSPNRQLHFTLVGEFSKMGRSSAEARLKALGAAIDDEVLPTTHYLVIGSPPSGGGTLEDTADYRRAKDWGIPILTETQLSSFTRY